MITDETNDIARKMLAAMPERMDMDTALSAVGILVSNFVSTTVGLQTSMAVVAFTAHEALHGRQQG